MSIPSSAIAQYQQVKAQHSAEDTNAFKVIQLLMEGAVEKIDLAILDVNKEDISSKGRNIGLAITIIDALQASLNEDEGGEIASNLFSLYQYMMERLVIANLENNVEILEEVKKLILTVKEGWDGIEQEAQQYLQD